MFRQVFRGIALLALVLVLASPAWANNTNVIFDPLPVLPGGGMNVYDLLSPGTSSVTWQNCAVPPLPFGSSLVGDTACLAVLNLTGKDITSISLSFVVPSALNGDTISCMTAAGDPHLTSNNCSFITLSTGENVTLSFFGGIPVGTNLVIDIGENGQQLPNPTFTAMVPSYDLSTGLLLLAGMSMLAMAGVRRSA